MKSRKLESKFFTDSFIETLTLKQRYLFLYYLFNNRVNWLGCYEITDRHVIFECGNLITQKELDEAKEIFAKNNKILFVDNYVILKNSEKYDNHIDNIQLMKSALKQYKCLPKNVQKIFLAYKEEPVRSAYISTFQRLDGSLPVDYEVGYSVDEVISNKKEVISNKKEEIKSEKTEKKSVTSDFLSGLKQKYPVIDVHYEWEKAQDYIESSGKKYKNHQAFFRNWIRRIAEDKGLKPQRVESEMTEQEKNDHELAKMYERGWN